MLKKNSWIKANPQAFAKKQDEASQVSATFLGTLLQVREVSATEGDVKKLKSKSISVSATAPQNN